MGSIVNNPTTCEVLIAGKRCENSSSYVYRDTWNTRLICDTCARQYLVEGSQAPILEFTLAELVPARQVLLQRFHTAQQAWLKQKAANGILIGETRVVWLACAVLFIGAAAILIGHPPFWFLVYLAGPLLGVGFGLIRVIVGTLWVRPRLNKIDRTYGFPELDGQIQPHGSNPP